jgi:glyoxylase-like metal-dependent hydrolase (beta-lactamase superfamily II)
MNLSSFCISKGDHMRKRLYIIAAAMSLVLAVSIFIFFYLRQIDSRAGEIWKEHRNGLYRLDLGTTNIYFAKCKDGWFMTDTGYPLDWIALKESVSTGPVRLNDIRYLFITHAHDDHCGFTSELLEATGARLIIHEKAADYLARGTMSLEGHSLNNIISIFGYLYNLFHKRDFSFQPYTCKAGDIILKNDTERISGIPGTFIHTPGHTSGCVSLLLDDGSVLCGDLAMNSFEISGNNLRPIFLEREEEVFRSWLKYGSRQFLSRPWRSLRLRGPDQIFE